MDHDERGAERVRSQLTVSVVIPALNAERTLGKTLAALRSQTIPDGAALKVIVSDDGSTDKTVDIASQNGDAVSVVRTPPASAHGPGAARNRGVAASSGDVVVFLDSDDCPRPRWLVQITDAFADPDVGIATWPATVLDASTGSSVTRRPDRGRPDDVLGISGCFALHRSVFDDVGGYDLALRFGENSDLCDRALARCRDRQLGVRQCDEVTVEIVFSQPSSHYDRKRLDAALHVLERDADVLATDAPRRGNLLNIAVVNAARCGEWSLARRCARRAIGAQPLDVRSYLRFLAVLVPAVTRRIWSSDIERPRF